MRIKTNKELARFMNTTARQISKARRGAGSLTPKVIKAVKSWGKRLNKEVSDAE